MSAIYVIHFRDDREFDGHVMPAGSREVDCVAYIVGGHVRGEIVRIDQYDADQFEGWARIVTEDIARACARWAEQDGDPISERLADFIAHHGSPGLLDGLKVRTGSPIAA